MLYSLESQMKALIDIDQVYKNITEFMSVSDRITYCECLIKETEYFLNTQPTLKDDRKTKYYEVITAAQIEIERLASGINS